MIGARFYAISISRAIGIVADVDDGRHFGRTAPATTSIDGVRAVVRVPIANATSHTFTNNTSAHANKK